jgi:hypothetical protein
MIDGTPFLKFYARRRSLRLGQQNAAGEQQAQLLKLVRRAAGTRFGRDHAFSEIHSVADFQARVRLRRYEDMWRDYWQPAFPKLIDCSWPGTIPYFALSSGTTSGTTKYIPCSHEMNRANASAALDVLVHHVRNRPQSRVLAGASFMLGGSTDLTQLAPGIHAGDLSGIAAARVPVWAGPYVYPPRELALIADWEKKIEVLALGIMRKDIRTIAGTPSWLLIFFERLFALHPDREPRLHAFFPRLDLLIHGGVNFAPYRPQFEALLEGSHAETREAYAASEGFIAAADRGPGEGMRLIADNGLFYEFVPVAELGAANPARHWAANIETGIDYAIVVTSCSRARKSKQPSAPPPLPSARQSPIFRWARSSRTRNTGTAAISTSWNSSARRRKFPMPRDSCASPMRCSAGATTIIAPTVPVASVSTRRNCLALSAAPSKPG